MAQASSYQRVQEALGFNDKLGELIQAHVLEEAEPMIQKAVQDYEGTLRRKVAAYALSLMGDYDVVRDGQVLSIRIRLEK
jgi:hypothetical protein